MVPDVGDLAVDGDAVVVERWRLQDDPCSAHAHRQGEDPQEEPVQHHGHVLPVLLDLGGLLARLRVLCDEVDARAGLVQESGAVGVVVRGERGRRDGRLGAGKITL